MDSSSNNETQTHGMTADEMKSLIETDVNEDIDLQRQLTEVVSNLRKKKWVCQEQIKDLQAPTRVVSYLEEQYIYYLKDKLGQIRLASKEVFNAGHTLTEQNTWAESFQENCGEGKTTDDVRMPENDLWWVSDYERSGSKYFWIGDRPARP